MKESTEIPIQEVKSQQSLLSKEDQMRLLIKNTKYYIKRPIYSGFDDNLVLKFDGNFSFWSPRKQMWIKTDHLFYDCYVQGQCEEITYKDAMTMIDNQKVK